ncbi:MAG: hypothetical protein ACKN95_03850, partial [Holophagaceae bacterium]
LNGKPGEESQLPGIQPIPLQGAGAGHELAEPTPRSWGHPLGDIVVVISPDGGIRMVPDPVDAGGGIDERRFGSNYGGAASHWRNDLAHSSSIR